MVSELRAVVFARSGLIDEGLLPDTLTRRTHAESLLTAETANLTLSRVQVPRIQTTLPNPQQASSTTSTIGMNGTSDFKAMVEAYEAQLIKQSLIECNWNQSEVSRRLRIPRRTLVEKIRLYRLLRGSDES